MARIFPAYECVWRDMSDDDAALAAIVGDRAEHLWHMAQTQGNHPAWDGDDLTFYGRCILEVARQKQEYEARQILDSEDRLDEAEGEE